MNYWLLHPREPLLEIYSSQPCLKMAAEALFIPTLHELSGMETLVNCKIASVFCLGEPLRNKYDTLPNVNEQSSRDQTEYGYEEL